MQGRARFSLGVCVTPTVGRCLKSSVITPGYHSDGCCTTACFVSKQSSQDETSWGFICMSRILPSLSVSVRLGQQVHGFARAASSLCLHADF